jgi:hypothetical protein
MSGWYELYLATDWPLPGIHCCRACGELETKPSAIVPPKLATHTAKIY